MADGVPADRYGLTYWLVYLQGVGTLLPWNMFITAYTYFVYKFGNDYGAPGKHKDDFENYFEVVSMVPNILFLFLNMVFKHLIGLQKRLVLAISIMFLTFVLVCILIYVNTFSWQNGFFALTLMTAFVVNSASAVYQSGLFGMAAVLTDGKYTQAIMGGQGLSGLFSALANIIALSASSGVKPMALGYFLSATFILAFCLVVVILMPRLKFVSYHLNKNARSSGDGGSSAPTDDNESKRLLVNPDGSEQEAGDVGVTSVAPPAMPNFKTVLRKIWHMALSVASIFFVTLAIFPAVSESVGSMTKREGKFRPNKWEDKYFAAFTTFLLFNAGDYAGRTAAGMVQLFGPRMISVLCLCRLAFIPLFAFCNAYPDARTAKVVFDSDVYPIVFMVLMALTNGYLSSLCMMIAPGLVDAHERETAGTMMAFSLGIGLTAGAGFSFLVKSVLT